MQVIHDDEGGGVMMIPLIVDWHISQLCQIEGCDEPTDTIVCFTADETSDGEPINIGICAEHHREAKATGKFHYTVLPAYRQRLRAMA